ncbi:MAG: phosphatase PAP2 family protein [Candidatus Gastranaerophilales bacterium]|nr:phosphatase PAP2 family protein [Candidatus Gastranaerophilales bacterium]
MKYKKELIIFSVFLLIFILDTLCVCFIPNLSNYELKINLFIQNILSNVPLSVPTFITDFGHGVPMDYLVLAIIILFLFFKNYKSLIVFFAALQLSEWIYSSIKIVIERPRPPVEYRLIEIGNYSFPSGHSTSSMVLYGLLIYFTWKYIKNQRAKITMTAILAILIVTIGFTRLWLCVHFLTDVIGGFSLGICIISILAVIDRQLTEKTQTIIRTQKFEEKETIKNS